MSNTVVGSIYKKIIDAVVEASRTDFEENGVSNDVLQALQETWQKSLSSSQRAAFPWDPQQTPAAPVPAKVEPVSNSTNAPPPAAASQQNVGGVQIKQEPGYDLGFPPMQPNANYSAGMNQPHYAHARAAVLLQQQFGNQASGSIGALQAAQMGLPGAQPRPQSSQSSGSAQQLSSQQALQQHQLQLQQQQRLQQRMQVPKQDGPVIKQEGGQNGLGLAQVDGAGDVSGGWDAILDERNNLADEGPTGRHAVDGMIRRHVEDMAQRLEGGGLLIPLDERRTGRKKQRRVRLSPQNSGGATTVPAATASESGSNTKVILATGYDGADDDSPPYRNDGVADDDAINSDLDDSEDELEGNIETNFDGDVILCLYDKVQRVKNKWKCTLKDGVVTVEGKDYVFHKAQGEFEW